MLASAPVEMQLSSEGPQRPSKTIQTQVMLHL